MTTKTIYVCDRCGEQDGIEEDFAHKGWLAFYYVIRGIPQTGGDTPYEVLCPSCTERALEKPIGDPYKWILTHTIPCDCGAGIGKQTELSPIVGCTCSTCESKRRKT